MDPLAPADANHLAFDLTFLKQSVPTEPVSKSRQTDSKREPEAHHEVHSKSIISGEILAHERR
jgi:hypothetical protein